MVRRRSVAPELMDEPGVALEQLALSLADLRRVNRWLGGTAATIRRLGPLILRLARTSAAPIRLLDVGTGSADLPMRLVAWSRRRGIDLRVVASDLHPSTARLARVATAGEPAIQVLRADALRLPFDSRSVHLALCSTTLHHFRNEDAVQVIRELDRVAEGGFLVSDLRRSGPAWLGARALAATVWRRHPVTRHDGPLSVAAAFTRPELEALARAAGVRDAVVRREPVFRVSLLVDRTGARSA
jgi:SAM-dependent methyltransferase